MPSFSIHGVLYQRILSCERALGLRVAKKCTVGKAKSDCLGSHYLFLLLGLVVLKDIASVQVYARENVKTRNTDLSSAVFCVETCLKHSDLRCI